MIRKAEATQDQVETMAYTWPRDFIGPTMPSVRRTVWDGDRPQVSAQLAGRRRPPRSPPDQDRSVLSTERGEAVPGKGPHN